ncbi:MAG TPA: phosphatase PAP2 family protein [Candidatus Kapabacteria bacterium]|nr:phosphatase PAP2 family protein [Candidatus Kapabacteria bacterium]
MTALDRALFLLINHGLNNSFNDYWIGYATWLGNGWIGFPIAILALLAIDRKSFLRNISVLAIAGIVGGIALNVIKQAVHAPRPLTVFAPDIAVGRAYVNVMFERLYWNSFPSGHTQTAFTIATVLIWAGKRSHKINLWGGMAIFAIASLVAVSRIYCGDHFPSDVLAGTVLGSGTALICLFAIERWQIKRSSIGTDIPKQSARHWYG